MGNAALVEQMTELWASGQLDRVDEYLDDQIEWLEPPETIGRNVVRGPEAALGALANWTEQFDSLRVETTILREESGQALHGMKQFARARGSTVDIEGDLYMVWWFRGGKAVRMEMYNTLDQAEAAFGRDG